MRSRVCSDKRFGFERLENRTVLNGTVFVTGALGALTLQGDTSSNYLLIRQIGTTPGGGVNIRVQGLATRLDNVDTGTSGSAFTFTGITNIAIDLSQGGNDHLTLINTNIAGQGDIAIGFGAGSPGSGGGIAVQMGPGSHDVLTVVICTADMAAFGDAGGTGGVLVWKHTGNHFGAEADAGFQIVV